MNKSQIDLKILLPDVPDERDACVTRIIEELSGKEGIEKVHIVPASATAAAQLCFHYNPDVITIDKVQKLAEQAGARVSHRYHHLLFSITGIQNQRQTRLLESSLNEQQGVLSAAVSGTGIVRLEFDNSLTTEKQLQVFLKKKGFGIADQRETQQEPEHGHHHHKHQHGDSDKQHHGLFGKYTELIFSLLCGLFLGVGVLISFLHSISPGVSLGLYIAAYFFGGFFTAKQAGLAIVKGGFEIDFLMLFAAVGAAILGDWAEGALLLFLFSLGHALEHYAMEKARKSITALAGLAPRTALLKTNDGFKEVEITTLKKGDTIVIKPNTKIAADGIVLAGTSSVNQAPITGESIPVDKTALGENAIVWENIDKLDGKFIVFAGTINGNGTLEVNVTRSSTDSTIARLVKMVNEAQTQKSPTQQFADKFEKYFVPIVLSLVVLLCFAFLVLDEPFKASFYRAMTVLVAASPCALAISTPSAVLSGVARAARAGVLIKGGRPLEELGTLTAVAFDKTGTLTEGKPKLKKVIRLGGYDEQELLKIVVSVESLSDHPIAKAIVRDGKEQLKEATTPVAANMEAILGKGIKATLGNDTVFAGNLALFEELDAIVPPKPVVEYVKQVEAEGNTTMVIRKNEEYIGIIAVMDTPRAEAKATLAALKKTGIRRMIMLTGDNQNVANTVAAEIGLTDAWGGLLPHQKVDAIRKLKAQEKQVAMVGDGVNDAPAMANSTVGIAMGAAGSDVALETADVALMGDKLILLPFAIGLSRKSKAIIRQNIWISLGMVAILVPLTLSGIAKIGPAVIAHEGSTLLVVFNALRLLSYKNDFMVAAEKDPEPS